MALTVVLKEQNNNKLTTTLLNVDNIT
jgi:hypothetical protein